MPFASHFSKVSFQMYRSSFIVLFSRIQLAFYVTSKRERNSNGGHVLVAFQRSVFTRIYLVSHVSFHVYNSEQRKIEREREGERERERERERQMCIFHVCTCKHAYIYVYIHLFMYSYIYIYTYIYI